ncbi:membrane protein [Streptomyces xanthochromogenes]|nr:membrane protein [Streptomyces xanthochromogenes]
MDGCAPVATYVGAVEQSRTRTPQNGQRARTSAPGPSRAPLGVPAGPAAAGESAAVYRAAGRTRRVPPIVLALRRLPSPRLTGLGGGLFAAALMFALGTLDWLLFDGSPAVYGVLFLPVCAVTALWVRPADLVTAPICVPIAFAVGIVPVAGGTGGFGGQAMAVVTALALHAGWLYAGTLVAGVIATVRKVRLMGRRRGPGKAGNAGKAAGPGAKAGGAAKAGGTGVKAGGSGKAGTRR